ncbi:MAG: DUF3849 domain-containing protein [Clostridia bacterium]
MANKKIEVYSSSRSVAKKNNELEKYVVSFTENTKCARAIEESLKNNFNGFKLKKDSAKEIIAEFGFDRTNFVLANSVQKKIGDKRIDKETRKWASSIYVPRDMVQGTNMANEYAVNSDTGLINLIAKQAQKEYENLNLIKFDQCNDPTGLDYTNKIMVLNPEFLYDEYKTPDDQIVKCGGGFGCSPTAIGRTVFGEYMNDNTSCSFSRSDFLGELKEEYYPQWLQEKLKQEVELENQTQSMEQSM